MMNAPYIEYAERYGVDTAPEIKCPCCGKVAESFYTDPQGIDILGCENCVVIRDAIDFLETED